MTEQFYTILTSIGKAKIANASAMGTKLNITKLQVGDGGGSYYNPTEEQEQLKNRVWEGNIGSITIDKDNKSWIVIETLLPGDIGGFMIREAGIFDSDGNLIAIGKYPETYKPITSQGSLKDLKIRMILEISNTSTVTLKIDPTVILATQKDIQSLNNKIKNIDSQYEEITNDIDSLKSHVDNGKSSLYSAIVGKKVTPRGKDFADLTKAIDNIKLGQGTATENDVVEGTTFTNYSGVVQTGAIKKIENYLLDPSYDEKILTDGYYKSGKIKGIKDVINNDSNLIEKIMNDNKVEVKKVMKNSMELFSEYQFHYKKIYACYDKTVTQEFSFEPVVVFVRHEYDSIAIIINQNYKFKNALDYNNFDNMMIGKDEEGWKYMKKNYTLEGKKITIKAFKDFEYIHVLALGR